MTATIEFTYPNGRVATFTPLNFKFVRERYTPYTVLSGHFLSTDGIENVKTISLYIDNTLVHVGMPDFIERKYAKSRSIVSLLSRSYSMLLGQNEPEPGIISNVDLAGLIFNNTSLPNVNCQAQTQILNYVYVKEKSTIWDAVCAYSNKAYGKYPFIYNTNTVRVTPLSNIVTHTYQSDEVLHYGEKLSTSGLYSQVYMADSNDQYSYSQTNSAALSRNIVRRKYYPLDNQWYHDPNAGLLAKLKYSNKGYIAREFRYKGHKFENLQDKASFSSNGFSINNELIAGVEVVGNSRGIFTKITVYRDSYA